MAVLEPYLERRFDPDSCACRKGKGVDAALRRAQALTRRAPWVLRSDIERCYPSMDHGVLKEILARTFKDRRLLELLGRIIEHGGVDGKGLPIGNLTSQWLANLYLDRVDRFVRQELRPLGYVRYMDDLALGARDRAHALAMRSGLILFLAGEMKVRAKERATQIYPSARGWPFLGFRMIASGPRVRRAT
ncbi:MAG: group II intron reverse transcriptase domain-containing protein [Planctomycetes bacterium]|nr:group II intron reverse transcriptase domain-containing protein [Planctomycetota bacterium]